jgi:hypothetical protein
MNEDISDNILIEISNNDIQEDSITDMLTPLIRQPMQTAEERLLQSIFSLPGTIINDIPRLPPPPPPNLDRLTSYRSPYLYRPPPPPPSLQMNRNSIFPEISNNNLQFSWINNPLPGRLNLTISGERIRPRRNFFQSRHRTSRSRRQILYAINNILGNNDYGGVNNLTNRVLEQSLYQEPESFKKVLSEQGKETVQNKKYYKEKYTDTCCPITYLDFKEGQEISELPCGHIFTPESILDWLENEKAECPICRYKLESKEVKKDIDFNLDISEVTVPTLSNRVTFFPNTISNSINTDVEMQRAILASIQNENSQEAESEISTMEYTYSVIPMVNNSNNSSDNDSWGEYDSDEDSLEDIDSDNELVEVGNLYPPPPTNSPPQLQENELENEMDMSIDDFFDALLGDEIIDEEIV